MSIRRLKSTADKFCYLIVHDPNLGIPNIDTAHRLSFLLDKAWQREKGGIELWLYGFAIRCWLVDMENAN